MKNEPTVIELYEKILNGKMNQFPKDYWQNSNSRENARILVNYVIREKHKWIDEDIKENFNVRFLRKNKLFSVLNAVYDRRLTNLANDIFPNLKVRKFKQFDHSSVDIFKMYEETLVGKKRLPVNFWQGENGKQIAASLLRYLIKEKLHIKDEDIAHTVTYRTIMDNKLERAYKLFDYDKLKFLSAAFPELDIQPMHETKEYRKK